MPPRKRARKSAAFDGAHRQCHQPAGRTVAVEHRRHVAVQSISTSSSTSSGSSGPDIVVVAAPPAIDTEAAAAGASTAGCPSLLEQLIWPMTAAEFMRDCFRKKAVCTLFSEEAAAAAGHEARTEALAEALARLELLPMMHESASEQIFVWMKPSSSGGGAAAASTGTGIGTSPGR
jgi:hypothetical protein